MVTANGGKDAAEPIIELVEQVTWGWLALAFLFGIAAGVTIIAFIGRERIPEIGGGDDA